MRRIVAAGCVLAISAACAQAGVAVGVKAGTLGLGAEATIGLSDTANLRLGVNRASIDLSGVVERADKDQNVEDVDITLELSTVAALLDWHCFESGFRLTGGAMLNNNEGNLTADVAKRVELGDASYIVSSLDGTVSFGEVAPYFGIGYGNAVDKSGRLSFALDFGVLLQGSPEVEMTATASNPSLQNALNADLEKESRKIEEDTEGITVYPVISLGFALRF